MSLRGNCLDYCQGTTEEGLNRANHFDLIGEGVHFDLIGDHLTVLQS